MLPEVQALLDATGDSAPVDLTLPLAELRAACDAGVVAIHHLVRDSGALHRVVDLEIAVEGGTIPARLYVPNDAAELGLHLHLHGGGWWMGSIATTDPMARDLAATSGLAVLSVGYRLAPEHRWPTAPEDVYAALQWVGTADLGFAVTTVSIGGESAGGNLAAVVTLMARDRGGPALVAQWLDVPGVDLTLPDTASVRDFGSGFGLDVAALPLVRDWYVDEEHVTHPYASPAHAPDLTGLPPALVTTAELDPLRDQGEAYAAALEVAQVPVILRRAVGHIHASSWLTALDATTPGWHDARVQELVALHRTLAVTP